jgi:hypothetical protein
MHGMYNIKLHKYYFALYNLWRLTNLIYINIYMHFILGFKIMYLNAWVRSLRPKHVAYIDKINNIRYG